MKIRKSIAYCYPTSTNAEILGQAGYYVQQAVLREDGTCSPPFIHQGHDVFDSPTDDDLLTLFAEADGEIGPPFVSLARRKDKDGFRQSRSPAPMRKLQDILEAYLWDYYHDQHPHASKEEIEAMIDDEIVRLVIAFLRGKGGASD